jgi:hypothetical protein
MPWACRLIYRAGGHETPKSKTETKIQYEKESTCTLSFCSRFLATLTSTCQHTLSILGAKLEIELLPSGSTLNRFLVKVLQGAFLCLEPTLKIEHEESRQFQIDDS